MKRKLQIFVSSTYKDLIAERQAAVEAILKASHIPAGMELFAAGDESQWETIKRWIEESDIYMLILGGRYGSIESKSQLSYTELEYDYAVSVKKPHFAVVIKEEALSQRIKAIGNDVLESANAARLEAFRQKVLDKTSSFFSDSKDIKLAIHESIRDLEARHKMTGWVSGIEIPAEAETLKKKLTENNFTDDVELDSLVQLLGNKKIDPPKNLSPSGELSDNVLILFWSYRHAFTQGLTNTLGAGEFANWLFSNLGPILETHELVDNQKIQGSSARQLLLSAKGKRFLAHIDKQMHLLKTKPKAGKP